MVNFLAKFPTFENQNEALLPVRVEALLKGVTDSLSLICIPSSEDVENIVKDVKTEPVEPPNPDLNHVCSTFMTLVTCSCVLIYIHLIMCFENTFFRTLGKL